MLPMKHTTISAPSEGPRRCSTRRPIAHASSPTIASSTIARDQTDAHAAAVGSSRAIMKNVMNGSVTKNMHPRDRRGRPARPRSAARLGAEPRRQATRR